MSTTNATFTTLFSFGSDDLAWSIEEDSTGRLYASSNAETRTLIGPDRHVGSDPAELHAELIFAGVPAEVADRYVSQAGL